MMKKHECERQSYEISDFQVGNRVYLTSYKRFPSQEKGTAEIISVGRKYVRAAFPNDIYRRGIEFQLPEGKEPHEYLIARNEFTDLMLFKTEEDRTAFLKKEMLVRSIRDLKREVERRRLEDYPLDDLQGLYDAFLNLKNSIT